MVIIKKTNKCGREGMGEKKNPLRTASGNVNWYNKLWERVTKFPQIIKHRTNICPSNSPSGLK